MRCHVNGTLVPASEATVSVHDRGLRYGDAVHARLRAYGGTVFEWERHEQRIDRAAEELGFADELPGDLRERVRETLAGNDLADATLGVSVTRGTAGGLAPVGDPEPTVVITATERPRGGRDGTRTWDAPARLQTVRTRASAGTVPVAGPTRGRIDAVLARRELERARTEDYAADEALVRDAGDRLVGGAASSVFLVDDGTLKTPNAARPAVSGVTRAVVLALAREESLPVETGTYDPADVRSADEAFVTNPRWELRPVAVADGVAVGTGPVTRLLGRLFDERVERRHYER